MIDQQTLINISYLNGLSVGFHIYRELVKSIESIAYDKDISYRDKKDKILENCDKNLSILEKSLNDFKADVESNGLQLTLNPETREYEFRVTEQEK